jgi:small subunit ribosomal protein S16
MVRIRLLRAGAKKRPFYRVIAIDQRRKRNGRALEFLGTYNPIAEPAEIKLETDRIEAWLAQGAQLTDAVKGLMRRFKAQAPAAPAVDQAQAPVAPAADQAPAPAAGEGE